MKGMHSPEHVDELRLAFDAGAIRRDARLREDPRRVDDAIDLSDHSEGKSPRSDRASGPTRRVQRARVPARWGRACSSASGARRPLTSFPWHSGAGMGFGLWRVCFPPCLVRPGRRLPVQGLSEGSLGCGRQRRLAGSSCSTNVGGGSPICPTQLWLRARSPDGLVGQLVCSHPGVLGSIPKRWVQG